MVVSARAEEEAWKEKLREEQKKGRERSFPLAVRRKRNDDYGELIRPEDFLRAEEKEDDNADAANVAADDEKLEKPIQLETTKA